MTTNRREPGDGDIADAVARYADDPQRAPLALRTHEAYGNHVAVYGRWLTGQPAVAAAIAGPRARDHAAREFKRFLKLEQAWKPASVNLALAVVDHFNRFVGIGPAMGKREPLAQSAPRALSEDEQRALLHAVEDAKPRDRAIVVLLLYTALRLSELVTLDVGDARVSARKGLLVVRSGKGDQYREVPAEPARPRGRRDVAEDPREERRRRRARTLGRAAGAGACRHAPSIW
jgi:integrase/recombinase XerC